MVIGVVGLAMRQVKGFVVVMLGNRTFCFYV